MSRRFGGSVHRGPHAMQIIGGDNRAKAVACYDPGYTLVEKLQTISTKFRRQ